MKSYVHYKHAAAVRATAILVVLEHGLEARGTNSSRCNSVLAINVNEA